MFINCFSSSVSQSERSTNQSQNKFDEMLCLTKLIEKSMLSQSNNDSTLNRTEPSLLNGIIQYISLLQNKTNEEGDNGKDDQETNNITNDENLDSVQSVDKSLRNRTNTESKIRRGLVNRNKKLSNTNQEINDVSADEVRLFTDQVEENVRTLRKSTTKGSKRKLTVSRQKGDSANEEIPTTKVALNEQENENALSECVMSVSNQEKASIDETTAKDTLNDQENISVLPKSTAKASNKEISETTGNNK